MSFVYFVVVICSGSKALYSGRVTYTDLTAIDNFAVTSGSQLMGGHRAKALSIRQWIIMILSSCAFWGVFLLMVLAYTVMWSVHDYGVFDRWSGVEVVEIVKAQVEKGAQMVYNQEGVATRFQLGVPFQIQTEFFCSWAFDLELSESQKTTYIKEELVDYFKIDMSEYLNASVYDYSTVNDWFSRKIKPSKRPIAQQWDESTVVAPADARLITFQTVRTEANTLNKFWIKGEQFTLPKLLDVEDESAEAIAEWDRAAMAIFRLAPQDYHRYHAPVSGRIKSISELVGSTYYSVSADAIRCVAGLSQKAAPSAAALTPSIRSPRPSVPLRRQFEEQRDSQ